MFASNYWNVIKAQRCIQNSIKYLLGFWEGSKYASRAIYLQKQPREVFYKKTLLKKFAIFTDKSLCWSLFLIRRSNCEQTPTFSKHLFRKTSANGCFCIPFVPSPLHSRKLPLSQGKLGSSIFNALLQSLKSIITA